MRRLIGLVCVLVCSVATTGVGQEPPANQARSRRVDSLLAQWQQRGRAASYDAVFTRTDRSPHSGDEVFEGRLIAKTGHRLFLDLRKSQGDQSVAIRRVVYDGARLYDYRATTRQIQIYALNRQPRRLGENPRIPNRDDQNLGTLLRATRDPETGRITYQPIFKNITPIGALGRWLLSDVIELVELTSALPCDQLPFLFEVDAAKLKEQYEVAFEREDSDHAWLTLKERRPRPWSDSEGRLARLVLDKHAFVPATVQLGTPKGKDTQTYRFTRVARNPAVNDANFKYKRLPGWNVHGPEPEAQRAEDADGKDVKDKSP